jgi:hypothetical protein
MALALIVVTLIVLPLWSLHKLMQLLDEVDQWD